jgi:hypothetical protein
MPTVNISQNSSLTDPTDLSAVNNTTAVTNAGYGGPHAVFDKDNYKAQTRLEGKLVEFSAKQGTITDRGVVWSIMLIAYYDTLVTEMLDLPQTDPDIKKFFETQMSIFVEKYQPKKLYFPALDQEILVEDLDGAF